jgi:hypothetical protein
MHQHQLSLRAEYRGADGLDEHAVAEVTLDHGHGPSAELEEHDHAVILAVDTDGQIISLR